MQLGKLSFVPLAEKSELAVGAVLASAIKNGLEKVMITEIDPTLSDTAAFCEAYNVPPEVTANCVIVEAKRGENVWYAACVILAIDRADINGVVRKFLDAKKASFASMEFATATTGMEYGGITAIGLPADWPIIVDSKVAALDAVLVGSSLRKSKIVLPGSQLVLLPGATVLNIAK